MRLIDADELWGKMYRYIDNEGAKMPYGDDDSLIHKDSACFLIENAHTIEPEPQWIPCSERLPEENVAVNITWVNHDPVPYYKHIKDKPFTATGVYFKGKWYWWSATVQDFLAEYGRAERYEISEETANEIEVIAWMPLPEPYAERRSE